LLYVTKSIYKKHDEKQSTEIKMAEMKFLSGWFATRNLLFVNIFQ